MEELAQYTILLDTKTKKNSHRIAGCGPRCPVCGKYAKQFIRNASRTTDFSFKAAQYLVPRPKKPIEGPVHLIYRIYTETWHRKDDLNLYEALDDILVKEGILKDDDRKTIRSRDGSRVLYDKENPRAEIYIYEYREEDDIWLRRAVKKCLQWISSMASTNQPTD
jgi:bacterioferritin-associated ferredoxin